MQTWNSFCGYYKLYGEKLCSRVTRATFSRFYARHRLARNFQSICADSYSKQTLSGYSAGFRLLLAYSAAELLASAVNHKLSNWKIHHPEVAGKLRTTLMKPVERAEQLFKDRTLKTKLSAFMEGDNNVFPAATVLRVMVAHGTFTPSGTDSLSRAGAGHVDALSSLLLTESGEQFQRWLSERIAQIEHTS
jgi:hypothetical protein